MKKHEGRRNFLRLAVATAGLATLSGAGLRPGAALAHGRPPRTQRLRDGIALITGVGGNVVAVAGDDGALLVDGGLEEHAEATVEAVHRALGTERVDTLFNTHWHPEQTGANRLLAAQEVPIVAHERTRLWLGQTVTWPWDGQRFEPLEPSARPSDTFHGSIERTVGGHRLGCGHLLQAHTDGDMYVHFHDLNVLVAGDVVMSDGWAFIDWWTGGWIGGMVDALDRLVDLVDDDTLIVPGRGPAIDRRELAAQRDMYGEIHLKIREMLMDGRSPDETVAARPADGYRPQWGSPDEFVDRAFRSQWAHEVPNA